MLLPLVIALTVFQGPGPVDRQKVISYSCPAQTLDDTLAQLSKLSGAHLWAQSDVGAQIFCIRLGDAPLGDVMDRLALAAGADWLDTREGPKLVRTPAKEDELIKESLVTKTAAIEKSLNEIRKKAAELQPWDDATAKRWTDGLRAYYRNPAPDQDRAVPSSEQRLLLDDQGPIGRAKLRLIGLLSADDLAPLPPFRSVVFSMSPNSQQRALPDGAKQVLADYVQEQTLAGWPVQPVVRNTGPRPAVPSGGAAAPSEYKNDSYPPSMPLKLEVRVMPQPIGMSIELELRVYDSANRIIESSRASVADTLERSLFRKDPNEKPGDAEKILPVSPMAASILQRSIATWLNSDVVPPMDPKLEDWLLTPEKNEPLALLPGEELVAYGDDKNVNVIACLADSSFIQAMFSLMPKRRWDTATFFKLCGPEAGYWLRQESGWALLRPGNPMRALATSEPRDAVGDFLREVKSSGHAGIEEAAAFFDRTQSEFPNTIGLMLMTIMRTNSRESASDLANIDLLRLYGSLSSEQRRTLASEGLHLGDFNRRQLELIRNVLSVPYVSWQGVDDLSEAIPNGLTSTFSVRAKDTVSLTFEVQYAGGQSSGRIGERDLAIELAMAQAGAPNARFIDQFQMANQRDLSFTFDFGSGIVAVGQALKDVRLIGPVCKTVAELPEDVRKRLEASIARNLQLYQPSLGGAPSPP